MPTYNPTENEQLFRYASGRWLWNEKLQLDARYRYFNVSSLKKLACEVIGSTGCISLEKIGEGNYNKAFRLVMQNSQNLIVKMPNPNAGPAMHTTASEVATMEFGRTVLNLPVPKVLAWSATSQNPVESEYIIMEEAKGSQLHTVWSELELRAKRNIIHQIVDIEKTMLSVSFDKIGSLYFKDSGLSQCESVNATAASPEVEDCIESRFSIGPIVRREFWAGKRSGMHHYPGPWKSAGQYLESIAKREIDWISTYAVTNKTIENPWQYTSDAQNSPEAHVSSLRKFISAISSIIPKDPDLCSPRFWHPDSTPATYLLTVMAKYQASLTGRMMMKLPDNFKQLEAFANATWDSCLFPFRECLVRMRREWADFDVDGPCPYYFSDEEIQKHQEEGAAFNENQEFWELMSNIVSDEGFTSKEDFGRAVELFRRLREEGLTGLHGEERELFEKQSRWAVNTIPAS